MTKNKTAIQPKYNIKIDKKNVLISFFIFIFFLAVYYLTSAGNTPYDYFSRLADAFLHGRYWLSNNPTWLSELIPSGTDRYYVVYPPMPAIELAPFVYIFKTSFAQQYLAHILGSLTVAFTFLISLRIKKDYKLALWSLLLIGAGSIIWFLSSVGSAWFLGQISACFFVTLAIYELLGKKRAFIIGLLAGAAYLSRVETILSLIFFLPLIDKGQIFSKKKIKLFLGTAPFLIVNAGYNFVRFGSFLDKAYVSIPGLFNEPWFDKGLFSLSYIPRHLEIMLLKLPKVINQFPYIIPSWAGMAIWITTPAFVYAFRAPIKKIETKLAWLTIALISLVIFSHGTTGFAQFGYRFAVDFYPFLIFLTIKGLSKKRIKWHHWLLLGIGIVVNLWGVLWINKFGWVEF
jgi:hypothetical protein